MTTVSQIPRMYRGSDPDAYNPNGVVTTASAAVAMSPTPTELTLNDASRFPQGGSEAAAFMVIDKNNPQNVKAEASAYTANGNTLESITWKYIHESIALGDYVATGWGSGHFEKMLDVLETLESGGSFATLTDLNQTVAAGGDIQAAIDTLGSLIVTDQTITLAGDKTTPVEHEISAALTCQNKTILAGQKITIKADDSAFSGIAEIEGLGADWFTVDKSRLASTSAGEWLGAWAIVLSNDSNRAGNPLQIDSGATETAAGGGAGTGYWRFDVNGSLTDVDIGDWIELCSCHVKQLNAGSYVNAVENYENGPGAFRIENLLVTGCVDLFGGNLELANIVQTGSGFAGLRFDGGKCTFDPDTEVHLVGNSAYGIWAGSDNARLIAEMTGTNQSWITFNVRGFRVQGCLAQLSFTNVAFDDNNTYCGDVERGTVTLDNCITDTVSLDVKIHDGGTVIYDKVPATTYFNFTKDSDATLITI